MVGRDRHVNIDVSACRYVDPVYKEIVEELRRKENRCRICGGAFGLLTKRCKKCKQPKEY